MVQGVLIVLWKEIEHKASEKKESNIADIENKVTQEMS